MCIIKFCNDVAAGFYITTAETKCGQWQYIIQDKRQRTRYSEEMIPEIEELRWHDLVITALTLLALTAILTH